MEEKTRLDRLIRWFKNNRLFSVILLGAAFTVGVSQLVSAITSLVDAGRRLDVPAQVQGSSTSTDGPHATLLAQFGSEGTGLGYFRKAGWLALLEGNLLAVGEQGARGRVQVFQENGQPVREWFLREKSVADGFPTTAMVGKSDVLTVGEHQIVSRFDAQTGDTKGIDSLGDWTKYTIIASGSDTSGRVYLLYEFDNGFYIVNDQNGFRNPISIKRPDQEDQYPIDWRPRFAIDGDGDFYLIDAANSFIYKFSRNGAYLARFGGDGMKGGLMHMARAIAVDGQGLVYVNDGNGLQVFDGDGRFITTVKLPGLDGVYAVSDMLFDRSNALWTASDDHIARYKVSVSPQ